MLFKRNRSTALALGALILLMASCSQLDNGSAIDKQIVVVEPTLELSKELSVHHSQSVLPIVTSKTADATEVDITSGSAELSYTMVVENVVVSESDTAEVANLVVTNTGSTSVTVDIADTLYCGDGSGNIDTAGPLAIDVTQETGVTIAAGASYTISGPFGPYDVSVCPDSGSGPTKDVVNRLTVIDSASGAVLASKDFAPTSATAISSIAAGFLVDAEELPSGYTVTAASLTKDGADVAFTATTSGNTYTIVTDEVADVGTYKLTKTLTRDDGVACEPDLVVVNTAYMSGDGTEAGMYGTAATATISLLCTPEEGGQGCTPGFWKEWTGVPPGNQPNAWLATGYHWGDPFTSAGFVDAFGGKTFLEVLDTGGGGKNALGRHAVAALLNAAHPDVSYDLTAAEVVAKFNDVMTNNGNVNGLKSEFEALNEQGCPLSQAVY